MRSQVLEGGSGRGLRLLLASGLLWTAGSCQFSTEEQQQAPRIQRGAVVSEHPLATAAGLEVLEKGGNAADAAVATALALAVVYPQAGNLGGGGFALCAGFGKEPMALDFREVAPRSTRQELYLDSEGHSVPERSVNGPLSVGVPGSPLGLYELHRAFGSSKLSWSELVAPAIALADKGFPVDPWLARDLGSDRPRARMNRAAREVFYPGGQALIEGQLLQQPDLARTLRLLADKGPGGFYSGDVAAAMLRTLQQEEVPGVGRVREGIVDGEDLQSYRTRWREPLSGHFEGYELIAMPPPSSGGLVILQVLAMLEGLPLGEELKRVEASSQSLQIGELLTHWLIEALRRSFADRAEHMGDPDFHTAPLEALISKEWILERRSSIGTRADLEVGAWVETPPAESKETTHLSVIDDRGGAVSMTTTLNGSFGSGILVAGAGFLLNNELDDFSIQAGVPNQFGLVGNRANAIEPNKRPLSSMSPTIVRDSTGEVHMVLGSPGGPRIITAVIQVLLRTLLLEEDLRGAVQANRLHQQWRPKTTLFESVQGGGPAPGVVEALERRGQPIEVANRRFGSVQAIVIDEHGEPHAVSDPRRGGAGGVQGQGVRAPALPPK